jgi:hypothetical protein
MDEPTTQTIIWSAIEIRIRYWPKRFAGHDHIEVERMSPRHAPLPITETGYRSAFALPEVCASHGGVVAFVRAWLDDAAKSEAWQDHEGAARQLSLF